MRRPARAGQTRQIGRIVDPRPATSRALARPSTRPALPGCAEAPVDFFESRVDLLLADWMRGRLALARQFRLGQLQRLDLALLLGINLRHSARAAAAFGFPFFDLFLDSRFRVNQAFSGISHPLRIQDTQRKNEERKRIEA